MRFPQLLAATIVALLAGITAADAAREARSITFPSVNAKGDMVYFSTWGDLWAAPANGSLPAWRLTNNPANEARAIPSPDGTKLAFVSDRYGSLDIFVMPIGGGGDWQRLTWGEQTDYLYDWKADGSAVLAYAMRQDVWGEALYEIPLDGGPARRITGPGDQDECVFGRYLGGSTDKFVYARGPGDWPRQNHHGTDCYDLFSFDKLTGKHTQLTDYNGNDLWPQPAPDGKSVYFVSDRDGSRNLFSLDLSGKHEPNQLSRFTGSGVSWPRLSSDGDQLAFEVAGELWLMDSNGENSRKVPVFFVDDAKGEMRIETDMPGGVDEYALSPNGKYFALGVYGDIFLLKNEDAYPPDAKPDQNLSLARKVVSTAGREMHIAWAPESNELAYVSDRDGSFDVYVMDLKTMSERKLRSTPSTEEWLPTFAPKGHKLAYYSGNRKLMLYDLDKNSETTLVEGHLKHGPYQLGYQWGPDGNWISFSKATIESYTELFIMNIDDLKPINVSLNAGFNVETAWSADGKWLAYSDYGANNARVMLLELNPEPGKYDLDILFPDDMEKKEPGSGAPGTPAAPAGADAPPPAAGGPPADAPPGGPGAEPKPGDAPKEEPKSEPIKIDTRRIELRGEAISGMAGNAASPKFDPTGKYLIFQMSPVGTMSGDEPPAATWWSMTLEERQFNQLTQSPGNVDPQFAPDGSKLYFRNAQSKQLGFVALQGPTAVGGGPLMTVAPVSLDQYAIWDQMLYEGWRHLRDTFYKAPTELGVDWDAVLERYRPRVQFCGTTGEFNNLYREMLGELGGSHLGFYGGGPDSEAPPENTADFGVWFDEGYGGPGWQVSRVFNDGPADRPGSKLYPGDIITQLDGQAIDNAVSRERALRNLAGRPIKLTVQSGAAALAALKGEAKADAPAPEATRDVILMPTSWGGMRQLVYLQWVEDNRALVEETSGGKVGYLHIQGMDQPSLEKFRRELFAMNLDKPGLIIDVRFNGGGNIHEQLFDILDQRVFGLQGHRGAPAVRQPALSYHGKIVVMMNAHSYSDAEIFPHIMQEMGLAKLVGEATGGNVIGTYDFPLLDGSMLRLPSWGWWLNDGTDMEGNGAQPDIKVIFDPELGATGVDNQLEAAITELMK